MREPSGNYPGYEIYSSDGILIPTEHTVDDARTKPRQTKDVDTSPKREKSSSKGRTILLTIMVTLLAFSLTLVTVDLLGSGAGISLYTGLFGKKQSSGTTYYAVYATHSTDMSVSYRNAAVIREEGGAGYVTKEGDEYYVILNLYDTAENAKIVTDRKANYGILEIFVPDFDTSKHTTLSAAENSKGLYREAYFTLYNAANDLASGKYQKEDMRRTLVSYKERVIAIENAYSQKIVGTEDTVAIEYKVILAEIRSAFENLEQNSEHPVADARYYSVMIVRSYALFAQKYFA